ncbi:MAG TPA: serine protease [Limnochorda sp.]
MLVPGEPLVGALGDVPDHYRTYVVDGPKGAGALVLSLQAKADLDLFVRFGRQMEDWDVDPDQASVTPASFEELIIDGPDLRPGTYYVDVANLVKGAPGGSFVLLATLRPAGDGGPVLLERPLEEQVQGYLEPGSRMGAAMASRDLVQFWAVDLPPGAQRLEVGLFDAEGPLDLVAAPEGALPIDLAAFPYAASTALENERLAIPVGAAGASRWWIGVVSREAAPVSYRVEARVDEPLPRYPVFRPDREPPASPVPRALAAAVQLSSSRGLGSGTLVSPGGLILTTYHVVAECTTTEPVFACTGEPLREADGRLEQIVVGLADVDQGIAVQSYYARLERALPEYDLALLRIDSDLNGDPLAAELPWVPLDLAPAVMAEEVLVIGYPAIARAGSRNPLSLTCGIVSGFTTHQGRRVLIQTDAAVNSGNSGGLMVRARDGALIGVPSDVRYDTERLEKQDYARPVQLLPAEWVDLIEADGGLALNR